LRGAVFVRHIVSYLLIFSIFLTNLFSPAPYAQADELDFVPPYEERDTSLFTRMRAHIQGTRHFDKKRGTEDPHYPKKIIVHKNIPLPLKLQFPILTPAMQGKDLNLNLVTSTMITGLSKEELKILLDYLSKKHVRIRYYCKGKWHVHPLHAIFLYNNI
jgi:hypothetical protein